MQRRCLRQTFTIGRMLLLASVLCACDRWTAMPASGQMVSIAHAGIARDVDDPGTPVQTAIAVTVDQAGTADGGLLFIPETGDDVLVAFYVQIDGGSVVHDESGALVGLALDGAGMQLFLQGKLKVSGDQPLTGGRVPTSLFVSEIGIEVVFDLRDGTETIRLIQEGGLNIFTHKLPPAERLLAIGEQFQSAALIWPDGAAAGLLSAVVPGRDRSLSVEVEIVGAGFEQFRGPNIAVVTEGVAFVSDGESTCTGAARAHFNGYRPQFYFRTTDVTGTTAAENLFSIEVPSCGVDSTAISTLRTIVSANTMFRDADRDDDGAER